MSVLHSQHISTCSSGQCTTFFPHLSKCGTPLNVLTQAPLLMTQNQWKCVLFLTSYSDLLKKGVWVYFKIHFNHLFDSFCFSFPIWCCLHQHFA